MRVVSCVMSPLHLVTSCWFACDIDCIDQEKKTRKPCFTKMLCCNCSQVPARQPSLASYRAANPCLYLCPVQRIHQLRVVVLLCNSLFVQWLSQSCGKCLSAPSFSSTRCCFHSPPTNCPAFRRHHSLHGMYLCRYFSSWRC